MPPSSAPETSPRPRGPFVASWPICAPARGVGDAAGDAAAHRAVAHPAHRRGEERPRARRHDGVEAPLRHCARHAQAAPPTSGVAATPNSDWPELFLMPFLVRARARRKLSIDRASVAHCPGDAPRRIEYKHSSKISCGNLAARKIASAQLPFKASMQAFIETNGMAAK